MTPMVSDTTTKAIRAEVRSWRLHARSESSLSHLAEHVNAIVTGWVTYYGRFYRSRLYPSLRNINKYLLRWAMPKYKGLLVVSWVGSGGIRVRTPCRSYVLGCSMA